MISRLDICYVSPLAVHYCWLMHCWLSVGVHFPSGYVPCITLPGPIALPAAMQVHTLHATFSIHISVAIRRCPPLGARRDVKPQRRAGVPAARIQMRIVTKHGNQKPSLKYAKKCRACMYACLKGARLGPAESLPGCSLMPGCPGALPPAHAAAPPALAYTAAPPRCAGLQFPTMHPCTGQAQHAKAVQWRPGGGNAGANKRQQTIGRLKGTACWPAGR